jgi:hypothetical protein
MEGGQSKKCAKARCGSRVGTSIARICAGICWYSKLAADVCQIVAARGISRGERKLLVGGIRLRIGLAKQDSFGIRLHVECGDSGVDGSNSADCALIRVPVRGSFRPLTL